MGVPFLFFILLVGAEYFGLAFYLPIYKALPIQLAISFLLMFYLVSKYSLSEVMKYKQAAFYLIFAMLVTFSLVHGFVRSEAINSSKSAIGYFTLVIVTGLVFQNRKQFTVFSFIFILLHAVLVLENLDKMGGERVGGFRAAYFSGDGNDFAWSLNVALPFGLYLLFTIKKLIPRVLISGVVLLVLFGIIGTQSRGASLSLIAGFIYYFFYISKSKSTAVILILVAVIGLISVAPPAYFNRMETISNYEEDTSAMGRLSAWKAATSMALDHPILGVGSGSFNSAYGRVYRKPDDPVRWISTHSVYFKILAENGFIGLFIYLLIIINVFKTNNKTIRTIEENEDIYDISSIWPKCLNWSLIGCSVSALFLSGVEYPHLFLITGMSIAANRFIENEKSIYFKAPNNI